MAEGGELLWLWIYSILEDISMSMQQKQVAKEYIRYWLICCVVLHKTRFRRVLSDATMLVTIFTEDAHFQSKFGLILPIEITQSFIF